MSVINSVVSYILGLDTPILLALLFFIIALIFRMKIGDAIKAALYVGIGYCGISLMVSYMNEVMSPALNYYSALGDGFTITDMPWTVLGSLQYLAPWSFIAIPIMLVLSIVMVRLKIFKTINLDIWNYGQFLLCGAFALVLFNSYVLGFIVTFALYFLCLFLADRNAERWSEGLGMPNTTNSTLVWMSMGGSICWVVNKILDLIPGVKNLNWDPKWMQKKLGIFGETSVLGLILGFILAIASRQDVSGVISMSVGMAAVMVLLPHMLKIFMEGIGMITNASSSWAMKYIGEDSDVYVAVDIAMTAGTPVAITVATLMYPLTILLAFIIPGIHYFPIGMMTMLVYLSGWCAMYCKQNFFRSLICAICLITVMMLISQFVSADATALCEYFSVEVGGSVTSAGFADWPYFILSLIHRFF